MFRHVVIFNWTEAATTEQRDAAVVALRAWGQTAKDYGALIVGTDAGLNEGNGDAVVVVDFPDRDSYRAYAADERHEAMLVEYIRPILGSRHAVQHEF